MELKQLYDKAHRQEDLDQDEAYFLYTKAPLEELMFIANRLRQIHNPGNRIGWMIDRNVNITNICFSQCLFCNFCRKKGSSEAYTTTIKDYRTKIDELISLGGDQLLLQGGMNPTLDLEYYTGLFRELKRHYPALKLHALGPPEVAYLARKEGKSYFEVLSLLVDAGLDSLPGAGAEILSDRVREMISPAKCTSGEWLGVMRAAHQLNLPTSATMMYGHVETGMERIEHLVKLRDLQNEKEKDHYGFVTFIPWPFRDEGTALLKKGIHSSYSGPNYIRLVAISRIVLNNIRNIQTSILTVGKEIAMMTLWGGANDLGSIMIEENVVSSAGSSFRFTATDMQAIIKEAGFLPAMRNQKYEFL